MDFQWAISIQCQVAFGRVLLQADGQARLIRLSRKNQEDYLATPLRL